MRELIVLTLAYTCVLGTCTPLHAATLHVPSEYPTIQDAIDAASEGDEILVAPGTYTGDGFWRIDFGGKDLILRSTGGPEVTILDLDLHYGPVFTFSSGESEASVVKGFSILRGENAFGGAFNLAGSSPTISECLIAGNQAIAFMLAYGGAFYIVGGAPTIEDCTIAGNMAANDGFGEQDSGGILFGAQCTLTLRRTIVWRGCS